MGGNERGLSEDSKGRNLFMKCVQLVERLRSAFADSMSPRMLLQSLQGTGTLLTKLEWLVILVLKFCVLVITAVQ
jgi:hypothetical protein